jgi:hypothetical protein
MAFDYKVIADASMDPLLIKDADYALGQWSKLLDGKGTLNLAIRWDASLPSGRADTDVTSVPTTTEAGRSVTISSAAYALSSGEHAASLPDNSGADAVISLDPGYVQDNLYIDPDPSASSHVPVGKIDAVSVFEHEIGHALGIDGYYPLDADSTSALGAFESRYDSFVAFQNGAPVFTGPHGEAANNGQPIPLTHFPASNPQDSQNIYHLGATAGDPFSRDLMTGAPYQEGMRYTISAVDVGIVEDITGLTAAQNSPVPLASAENVPDLSTSHGWQHPSMAFMHGGNKPSFAGTGNARPAASGMGLNDFGNNHAPRATGGANACDPRIARWTSAMHGPGHAGNWIALPNHDHSAQPSAVT